MDRREAFIGADSSNPLAGSGPGAKGVAAVLTQALAHRGGAGGDSGLCSALRNCARQRRPSRRGCALLLRTAAVKPVVLMLGAGVLLGGCRPELGPSASLVTETRVLAVRGAPAEAAPGQTVVYQALVASPGPAVGVGAAPVAWSYCLASKPLTENNVVAPSCVLPGSAAATIAAGATPNPDALYIGASVVGGGIMATVPADACRRFGPIVPPTQAGQPPLRPRDPDVTGGFFQPVILRVDHVVAVGLHRLRCDLANAPLAVAQEFRDRYTPNNNPTLSPLRAFVVEGAGEREVTSDPIQLPAGGLVRFQVGWPVDAAESYPRFEPGEERLVDQRESLRVSWFATAGTFESDATGGGPEATTTDNRWTAPSSVGAVALWLVLRDSRGGVAFASYSLRVAGP
jgi:hypothetical protein